MSVPILITVIIALIGFGFGAYAANRRDSKRIKGMNNDFPWETLRGHLLCVQFRAHAFCWAFA